MEAIEAMSDYITNCIWGITWTINCFAKAEKTVCSEMIFYVMQD